MSEKQFNPTVTALFPTQSGNFMSPEQDAAGVKQIKEAVASMKPGDVFFLKKSKTPNRSGKHTYFLEVINPKTFSNNRKQASKDGEDI